jgi:hypothetical protein
MVVLKSRIRVRVVPGFGWRQRRCCRFDTHRVCRMCVLRPCQGSCIAFGDRPCGARCVDDSMRQVSSRPQCRGGVLSLRSAQHRQQVPRSSGVSRSGSRSAVCQSTSAFPDPKHSCFPHPRPRPCGHDVPGGPAALSSGSYRRRPASARVRTDPGFGGCPIPRATTACQT